MARARTFTIRVVGDATNATKSLKKFGADVGTLEGTLVKASSGMSKMFAAVGVALAGGAIVRGITTLTNAAYESQKVMKQTEAIVTATGAAARMSAGQIGDLAESLSLKTAIDDEAIQTSLNLLLTFKQVRNEAGEGNDVFNRAAQAMLDLGNVFGSSDAAAVQLGKALSDPVRGVTALRRSGINFSQSQQDMIKALVDSNKLLDAQKIILTEVESQVGGTAAATATAADRFKVAWENAQEDIGALLIPLLEKLATYVQNTILPIFKTFADVVGEQGVGAGVMYLAGSVWNLIGGMGAFGKLIQTLVIGFVALKTATITYTAATAALNLVAKVGTTSMQAFATSVNGARLAVAAAGGITAIITIAATAYAMLSSSKASLEDTTRSFTQAIQEEGQAQIDAANAAAAADPKFRSQLGLMDSLGISFQDVARYVKTGVGETELFAQITQAAGDTSGTTAIAILDLGRQIRFMRDGTIAADEATRFLNASLRASETAAQRSKFAFQILTNEFAALGAILGIDTSGNDTGGGIGGGVQQTETAVDRFLKAMAAGAQRAREEWAKFRDEISSNITGLLDLGSAFETAKGSPMGTVRAFRRQGKQILDYTKNLSKLQGMGLGMPALQQIMGMDLMTGADVAAALVSGGMKAIRQVNRVFNQVAQAGAALGGQFANQMVPNGAPVTNNNVTQNITVTVTNPDPNAVVNALRRYGRSSGAIPIAVRGSF